MERLPFVDVQLVPTALPAERVWRSLATGFAHSSPRWRGLARLLGCEPAGSTPTFTAQPGDAVPGFRVVDVEPPTRLVLEGRHRFSHYRLEFVIGNGRLAARTYADFPGWPGRTYRLAVISSGAHRVATRRMLRRVLRDADARLAS